MTRPHLLSQPEILYLKRFFDAVDSAVTAEVNTARVAYEEFLSPVLGRLLDDSSPFQSLLSYSSRQLNLDLAECGSGNRVDVTFETNEHAKGFSGRTSHADLGIVFRRENPLLGARIEKAILVECKRLYPTKKQYTVRSRYDGFEKKQYNELKKFAENYGWNGVYYFLYNPSLEAFEERSRQVIRAWENTNISNGHNFYPYHFEELYYIARRYGLSFNNHPGQMLDRIMDADDAKNTLNQITKSRPGVKVIGLDGVKNIIEKKPSSLSLSACYDHALSYDRHSSSHNVPFVSLSNFIVDYFISCFRGSEKSEVVSMAQGRDPRTSGSPGSRGPGEIIKTDDLPPSLLAQHTLTITLTSELPEVEGQMDH